jgi:hypothetical protein
MRTGAGLLTQLTNHSQSTLHPHNHGGWFYYSSFIACLMLTQHNQQLPMAPH